ncbi:hypothetical protein AAG570_013827 [Ranatra chinensis]|uniref:C2H2-type domain-containing protein n=1 Tax=Ranatra chinensis TaxID=642074 RepID=A0ABD0YVT7_9HEMI
MRMAKETVEKWLSEVERSVFDKGIKKMVSSVLGRFHGVGLPLHSVWGWEGGGALPPMSGRRSSRGGKGSVSRPYSTVWDEVERRTVYWCLHCDYKSKEVGNVKRHYNDKHCPHPRVHRCEHCQYSAKQKSTLMSHVMSKHILANRPRASRGSKIDYL